MVPASIASIPMSTALTMIHTCGAPPVRLYRMIALSCRGRRPLGHAPTAPGEAPATSRPSTRSR